MMAGGPRAVSYTHLDVYKRQALANHVVVNDDLERTVTEMMQIIEHHRMLR